MSDCDSVGLFMDAQYFTNAAYTHKATTRYLAICYIWDKQTKKQFFFKKKGKLFEFV